MEKPDFTQLPGSLHNLTSKYMQNQRYSTPIPKLSISGYIHAKKTSNKLQKKLSLDLESMPNFSNFALNTDSIQTPRVNYVPKLNPGRHLRYSSD